MSLVHQEAHWRAGKTFVKLSPHSQRHNYYEPSENSPDKPGGRSPAARQLDQQTLKSCHSQKVAGQLDSASARPSGGPGSCPQPPALLSSLPRSSSHHLPGTQHGGPAAEAILRDKKTLHTLPSRTRRTSSVAGEGHREPVHVRSPNHSVVSSNMDRHRSRGCGGRSAGGTPHPRTVGQT